jgi:hypothetical protein
MPEPLGHHRLGPPQGLLGLGLDLLAGAEEERRIAAQLLLDRRQLGGAEQLRAQAGHLGADARHLFQSDAVDLVGGHHQRGVDLDQALVAGGTAGDVAQADRLVGAGPGEDLVPQDVAVAGEGGADALLHRRGDPAGQRGALGVRPAGVTPPGRRGQHPVRGGRRQQIVQLPQHPLHAAPGGDLAGGQAPAQVGDAPVEIGSHLLPAAHQAPGVLGGGHGLQVGQVQEQHLRSVAGIDRPLVQVAVAQGQVGLDLAAQGPPGHPVAPGRRRQGVDPRQQRLQPLDVADVPLRGLVGHAVVEAAIAQQRGLDGIGLHAPLPVLGGQTVQGQVVRGGGCGHGRRGHLTRPRQQDQAGRCPRSRQ